MAKSNQIVIDAILDSSEFSSELKKLNIQSKNAGKEIGKNLNNIIKTANFDSITTSITTISAEINKLTNKTNKLSQNYSSSVLDAIKSASQIDDLYYDNIFAGLSPDLSSGKYAELLAGYINQTHKNELKENAYQNAGGFLGSLNTGYDKRLTAEQNYLNRKDEIMNTPELSEEQQIELLNKNEILKQQELANADLEVWRGYGKDVAGIFEQTFTGLLTGQKTFGESMKSLTISLGNELLKILWEQALKKMLINTISNVIDGAGGWIKGFLNIFKKKHSGGVIPRHHDGTIVPMSMNTGSYDLGGTAEQLALLKGGERVLSPAENVSYEQGADSGSRIHVVNLNIKAWDGKDVINTLRENANIIQQITANGLKNNQNSLRTIVQGI